MKTNRSEIAAPYHSTKEAPTSRSKKQELYDWYKDSVSLSQRANVPDISTFRRPELWRLVQQLKKGNEYYVIDREAEKYGHIVVR